MFLIRKCLLCNFIITKQTFKYQNHIIIIIISQKDITSELYYKVRFKC